MQCGIRKSCSLRDAVYAIGKMTSPVGIILVDTTGIRSNNLAKSPRDKFMEELTTVFCQVGHACFYSIETDVRDHKNSPHHDRPIVVELGIERAFTSETREEAIRHLHTAGVCRIVMVGIVHGVPGVVYANKLMAEIGLRDGDNTREPGLDAVIVVDDEA